jgi:hypothetical protein
MKFGNTIDGCQAEYDGRDANIETVTRNVCAARASSGRRKPARTGRKVPRDGRRSFSLGRERERQSRGECPIFAAHWTALADEMESAHAQTELGRG